MSEQAVFSQTHMGGAKTLLEAVQAYESTIIRAALSSADGSISRAANLMNISHQSLDYILVGRQKELMPLRKTRVPRRRSIMRKEI
jgi:transcriptional regulator with PAS, ATPase and Fis domain